MEAIILAGGLGSRLKSVVKDLPKPMANVNGKPFLDFVLDFLAMHGVKCVILALSYKKEIILKHFKNSYKNMQISYSIENEPLGTGGALKKALKICKGHEIFVCNGDTIFDINLSKMLEFKHKFKESKICLGLKMMRNFERYGRVECDEMGFVKKFIEKKFCESGLINGGIYLLNKDIFEDFFDANLANEKFSFEDFLQTNFKALKAVACAFDEYFIDIGVPEDYEKFVLNHR